ncbi:hypothetical protein [Brucella sp. 2716]|uniref:hypothetical protein n=1 Tax=Brucella sp. 2716 TaxID=2975052 RepID=UPI00217ED01A|nr:hypothetical protein [Brucella sp. 2716]UWF58330.1 hypothetical protein NYO66_07020 [Brucella sp. 2716]
MMKIIHKLISHTLFFLLAAGANASYGNPTPSMTQLEGRPSNIPEDYVATPGGYLHPKCIVTVKSGETVKSNGKIISADGSERSIQVCDHVKYTKFGKEIRPGDPITDRINDKIEGWEASISHSLEHDNGIQIITGEWTVPLNPWDYERQTLFLFNSIRTADQIIIQPVLGFNQLGAVGPQWSIASWAVGGDLCGQGSCKSANTPVQPGDVIRGTLTRNIPYGTDPQTVKKWRITISVLRNGVETGSQNLDVELPTSNYLYFDEAAYETYDAKLCGQIDMLVDYSGLNVKFNNRILKQSLGYSGIGEAVAYIYDRKCAVKTNIERSGVSTIYYGDLN